MHLFFYWICCFVESKNKKYIKKLFLKICFSILCVPVRSFVPVPVYVPVPSSKLYICKLCNVCSWWFLNIFIDCGPWMFNEHSTKCSISVHLNCSSKKKLFDLIQSRWLLKKYLAVFQLAFFKASHLMKHLFGLISLYDICKMIHTLWYHHYYLVNVGGEDNCLFWIYFSWSIAGTFK